MTALILVAAVAVAVVVLAAVHTAREHGPAVIAGRVLLGRHPTAHPRRQPTNARGWHPGTEVLHPSGHAGRWWHIRPLYRALAAQGALAALVLTIWGLSADRGATILGWKAAVAVADCAMLSAAMWHWLGREHRAERIEPLKAALPGDVTIRKLTPAMDDVRIAIPARMLGHEKALSDTELAIRHVLGLTEATHVSARALAGSAPMMTFAPVPDGPPGRLAYAEIAAEIAAAPAGTLVLGQAAARETVSAPLLTGGSPHVGLSMITGAGKSSDTRLAAAQIARGGGLLAICDVKLVSHTWSHRLPNVAAALTPEQIHDLLMWLAGDPGSDPGCPYAQSELQRRNESAFQVLTHDVTGEAVPDVGPPIFVIIEELNALAKQLSAYWKRVRPKGAPAKSPAVTALDTVLFTGRQAGIFIWAIGQKLSAAATSAGSGDSRENFGYLLLSDPSVSTWKMLVGDLHPRPAPSGVLGRRVLVTPADVKIFQSAYISPSEARALALSGVIAQARADMPCIGRADLTAPATAIPADVTAAVTASDTRPIPGPDLRIVTETARPVAETGPAALEEGPRRALTVAEAVAAGLWGNERAANRAVHRARLRPADGRRGVKGSPARYAIDDLIAAAPKTPRGRAS